jgi:hypothetical protein
MVFNARKLEYGVGVGCIYMGLTINYYTLAPLLQAEGHPYCNEKVAL